MAVEASGTTVAADAGTIVANARRRCAGITVGFSTAGVVTARARAVLTGLPGGARLALGTTDSAGLGIVGHPIARVRLTVKASRAAVAIDTFTVVVAARRGCAGITVGFSTAGVVTAGARAVLTGLPGGARLALGATDAASLRVIRHPIAGIGLTVETSDAAVAIDASPVVASARHRRAGIAIGLARAGARSGSRAATAGAGLPRITGPARATGFAAGRRIAAQLARQIRAVNAARAAAAVNADACGA